jgi:hypothetical protein
VRGPEGIVIGLPEVGLAEELDGASKGRRI